MLALESRLCETCLTRKAIGEFRLRSRGGAERVKQCRACHNAAERERRAAKRELLLVQSFKRLQGERRRGRIEALCNAMLDELGGVAGFVEAWQNHYRRSSGLDRIRCLKVVLQLAQVAGRS